MADIPTMEQDDPQSAIASILSQMQNAEERGRPIETIANANMPVPTRKYDVSMAGATDPNSAIASILSQMEAAARRSRP